MRSKSRWSTNSRSAVMIFSGAASKTTVFNSIRFADESATILVFLIGSIPAFQSKNIILADKFPPTSDIWTLFCVELRVYCQFSQIKKHLTGVVLSQVRCF